MRILICVTDLPYATATLKFGNLLAGLETAEVTLLTVIEHEHEPATITAKLAEAQALLNRPVDEMKIYQGNPVDEIVRASREHDYDVIVLGMQQESDFFPTLMKSISHQIANKALSSVLIVKQELTALKRILICTGGHEKLSRRVVQMGVSLARLVSSHVNLLHVSAPQPGMYTGLRNMDESLADILQSNTPLAYHLQWGAALLDKYQLQAKLTLRQGLVAEEIVNEAETAGADLIVVGARDSHLKLADWWLNRVASKVVEYAPCSVLVVR